MSTKLTELREEFSTKQGVLLKLFADRPERDFSIDEVEDIRTKNKELNDLGERLRALQEAEDIVSEVRKSAERNREPDKMVPLPTEGETKERRNGPQSSGEFKTLGMLFTESPAFQQYDPASKRSPTITLERKSFERQYEQKATLDTGTWASPGAWPAFPMYLPGVQVQMPLRRPVVADMIPQGETAGNQIVYMEETTVTNAAAAVAEGGTKPESALGFLQRNAQVRKLATVLPVTDELLQDQPAAQAYVDGRLRIFMQLTEESQLVSGSGVAPNLQGILNTPNILNVTRDATNSEPGPDAVYRAMTLIRTTAFLEPTGIIFHPNDWRNIRLLRTNDGIYIWGSPADQAPERIWGMNIVQTTVQPQGQAIVGAFDTAAQIFRKQDIAFSISDQHADFFIRNMLMLRVEERLSFVVYRPAAFSTVSGL